MFLWLLLLSRISVAGEAYVATGVLASEHATQAAAADAKWVYAVSSKRIAKLERETGREVSRSSGEASHLNSAVIIGGKIFSAHSNFPKLPEESDLRIMDPETMTLEIHHRFEKPAGSLTWAIRKDRQWWCHFAHYGLKKERSVLIRYNGEWKETGRWNYPPELIKEWGMSSLSGGIWQGEELLATGHDDRVIFRLKVPAESGTIEWLGSLPSPFPGQGIAADLKSGGLVGIDRAKKQVVFAELQSEVKQDEKTR